MMPIRSVALAGLWVAAFAVPHAGWAQAVAGDADIRSPRFLLAVAGTRKPIDVQRTPSLSRHVALNLDGVPLPMALEEISRQSGLRLAYTADVLPPAARVRLVASEISVAGALSTVLLDAGVDVVFTRDGQASLVRRVAVAPPGSVTGMVTDAKTAQGLVGAEVLLEGTRWRALAGDDGRYRLADVEAGNYTLVVRRIGYGREARVVTLESGQELTADFALQPLATKLQDVVVTAQKREERLIDAPQSVSVLSSDALAKMGATQFRDFANTVPGLNFTTAGAGFTQISLRGVTTGSDVGPNTAVYVDEVPYGSGSPFTLGAQLALDAALFDIDRIEVLRGPQGTLYGASAMGGLLKYVTKQPDATRLDVDAQAGTSGTRDGGVNSHGAAAVNAPIAADKVTMRASGFYSRDGGYVDNLLLSEEDVNRSDTYGGRLGLLITPASKLSVRINGFLQDIKRDGDGTVDYTFSGSGPFGDLGQSRHFAEPFNQRFRVVSGTLNYDLGRATLSSISAYQTVRTHWLWDLSALFAAPPISALGVPSDGSTNKFTQEVRLASQGSQRLEWLIGGFYNHETSRLAEVFVLRDSAGRPVPNNAFDYLAPSRYDELAAFGDLTWHFTDKFDVTGGLRYARTKLVTTQYSFGVVTQPTASTTGTVDTYLLNARYHFTDRATAYVRFATGYRPGGPNFAKFDPGTGQLVVQPPFEADRLESYEAGLKAQSADQRFGIEVAAYHIDWSNIQISVNNAGFSGILNAPGGATIRGAELTLTGRPTEGFTVTGTSAYTDASVNQADDATHLGAAEGERLPITPRFAGSLNADYELPVGRSKPTVGATLRYASERTTSFDNSASFPQYHLPEYTTIDLRAGMSFGAVNTQIFVHNLTDERSQLSLMFAQFGARVAISQPRTIGVVVSTKLSVGDRRRP